MIRTRIGAQFVLCYNVRSTVFINSTGWHWLENNKWSVSSIDKKENNHNHAITTENPKSFLEMMSQISKTVWLSLSTL